MSNDNQPEIAACEIINRLFSIPALFSRSVQSRLVDQLVALGSPAVPAIIRRLQQSRNAFGWHRSALAAALGRIGDRSAVSALIGLLNSDAANLDTFTATAWSLQRLGATEAAPALASILDTANTSEVYPLPAIAAAAEALAAVGGGDHVPTMCHVLPLLLKCARSVRDERTFQREGYPAIAGRAAGRVVVGLGRLRDPRAVPALLTCEACDGVIAALVRIGPLAIPALIEALRNGSGVDAGVPLRALVGIGPPSATSLRDSLRSRDRRQAALCAVALACVTNGVESAESLLSAFEDSDTALAAAQALVEQPDLSRIPILRGALPDLKRHSYSFRIGRDERIALAQAAEKIDAATSHLRTVPVAASRPACEDDNLPLPASTATNPEIALPIADSVVRDA